MTKPRLITQFFHITLCLLLGGIAGCAEQATEPATRLKTTFAGKFKIGTALNGRYLRDINSPQMQLVIDQFDTVTSANALKWGPINPQPGEYDFESADRFIEFADSGDFHTIGHVLFWHSQTPDWVFEDDDGNPLTRDALLARMRERVQLYADRYGDKVDLWDVVNESITDDGEPRDTKFHQIIGADWEAEAFKMADEILPKTAKLIYNDYGMNRAPRRAAVVAMVQDFQARGIRIDGVGMQAHWSMDRPTLGDIEDSILAFADLGVEVHLTEFDIDFLGRDDYFGANVDAEMLRVSPENNPYPDGLPPEAEARFTQRYVEIFELLLKHADKIDRVTFWGVTDQDSWLNFFPVRGRTNYALLFDREGNPKPAYHRLLELANATP